jgi:HEAT repeat protein
MLDVLALAQTKQPWLWSTAVAAALVLLLVNISILLAVHVRRLRQYLRGRRERRFHAELEEMLLQLESGAGPSDVESLHRRLSRFDELERPVAALALIERLRFATEAQREHALHALREAGAIDLILQSTRRWMPWRRALAVRTLGWIGAGEAVPVLVERTSDRSRYVRESAVRALGRIGDARAVPVLAELFRAPGRVGQGIVYDALIALGPQVAPVFEGALRSELEPVRIASCFGVAALSEPEHARALLEPGLDDPSAAVRAAAAESLAQIGGPRVPAGLARATRDDQPTVRGAAVGALGSYDDAYAVELAQNALLDPSWVTAVRAGESLVRLARRAAAAEAAAHALRRNGTEWPVERAQTFASLGAV